MKIGVFIITSFVIFPAFCGDYQSNYHLTKIEQENCFQVQAQFQGNDSDELLLHFPHLGISNLDIKANKPLKIKQTDNLLIYKIQHQKEDLINVQYQFCAYNPEYNLRHGFVDANSFYFSGSMVLPVSYNNFSNKHKVHISLENIDPNFFYTSVSQHVLDLSLELSPFELNNLYFMYDKKEPQNFNTNHGSLTLLGLNNTPIPVNAAKDIITMLQTHGTFWNDNRNKIEYLVFNLFCTSSQKNGILFLNTLTINVNDFYTKTDWLSLLSSCYFYQWLGFEVPASLNQSKYSWLVKGLSQYFGERLLYESNIFDDSEYIQALNQILAKYYGHPLRVNNKKDNENFFKSDEVSDYKTYLAALITQEPHLNVNGSFNNAPLSQAIKALKNDYTHLNTSVMNDRIIENAFMKHLTKETFKEFMDIIHRNRLIKLPQFILNEKAVLKNNSIAYPDYGFNLTQVLVHKKVTNLDKSSQAYRIGIRENDLVLSHEIPFFDKKSNATLVISKNGVPTVFKIPIHKIIYRTVPQYTLL